MVSRFFTGIVIVALGSSHDSMGNQVFCHKMSNHLHGVCDHLTSAFELANKINKCTNAVILSPCLFTSVTHVKYEHR